ncbi:cupin domain-containing protein [Opitutales bacterium]|nr:cupin domain-containing protein [Opitutales bacterium]
MSLLRLPQQIHQWHDDIESSTSGEGFISIWMGLEDTNKDTSLKVVPGSHKFNRLLFQIAKEKGVPWTSIEDEIVIEWSNELQGDSRIEYLDTTDGDALIFDGRLWHGSRNTSTNKRRLAVLLQYARADKAVRIPKFGHKRWPMEYHIEPKPPCLLVRGSSQEQPNTIMAGPPKTPIHTPFAISTLIETLDYQDNELGDEDLKIFQLVRGPTSELSLMECHYSILAPRKWAHPPHIHDEEEIQMMVVGEADLIAEDEKGSNKMVRFPAKPGDYIYHPANWRHTFENNSDKPAVTVVFKWISDESFSDKTLPSTFVNADQTMQEAREPADAMVIDSFIRGKTGYLRTIESHMATLQPGQPYDPHQDAYDVAIIHFEGTVETIGETVSEPSVIYYSAGIKHGMKNIGDTVAKHIAIEFHGKHGEIYESPRDRRRRRFKESFTNPGILIDHLKWRINQLRKKGGYVTPDGED